MRAHWADDRGATWCVRCDSIGIRPLTFEDWCQGRGGEDARDLFEHDLDALRAGTASPEFAERMRQAFAEVA